MRKLRPVALALLVALELSPDLTFTNIAGRINTSIRIQEQPQDCHNYGTLLSFTHDEATDTKQAPKTNCTPAKLTAALVYMQKSRVAHTLKDLEKHLPSVAQINGMQVKGIVANFL
jgi:hypothetical protein